MRKPEKPRYEQFASVDEYLDTGDAESPDGALELKGCKITQPDIGRLFGKKLEIFDCHLTSVDLSMFEITTMQRCVVDKSKLRATRMRKSLVKNVVFNECLVIETDLRNSMLEKVQFKTCTVRETDFYQSELKYVDFTDSEFTGLGFDQAKISDVDMSRANLQIADPTTMSGVEISEHQLPSIALELAQKTGLIIKDG